MVGTEILHFTSKKPFWSVILTLSHHNYMPGALQTKMRI